MSVFASSREAAWSPLPELQQRSHLWRLMQALSAPDVDALHAIAIQTPARYYAALVDHLNISFSQPYCGLVDLSKGPQFPAWFPGGRLNVVDTCLCARDRKQGARTAVSVVYEDRSVLDISYAELRARTQQLANYLTHVGVKPGDCVGLFMAMNVEATIAFFACAWVGAVAVPAFSGYGPEALATRLHDCRAKVLIASNGFERRGKWIDMASVAHAAVADLTSPPDVICVGGEAPLSHDTSAWTSWNAAIEAGANMSDCAPVKLDPNAPLMLMYTSGTTGRPKGIVHSHAGFLVKVASDYALAFDACANDSICWITDLGWLVGPQMIVGCAALGARAVYYVGALDTPTWEQVWSICAQQKITVLGLSPTAVRGMAAVNPHGVSPDYDLSALRAFASTGEPWDGASWRWLFDNVGRGLLPILNYSGGTEVGGGILTCYAALPLAECAFTGPVIGMDADILDPEGQRVDGGVGELVVRNLWPGMTHSFWGGGDALYLETYWSAFPSVWRHGDLAQRDDDGWWFVRGRSDDTLKVAGRRVGPAEIESALLQSSDVLEAVVVGIPDDMKGQSVIAFVVCAEGRTITAEALQACVRRSLGPSLVPSKIYFVTALPKTRNGKIVRRAITARYLGLAPGDLSTLDNADALLAIPARASLGLA